MFEADLRSGELRKQGIKIKLHHQPFQVLAMLLEHPGEVVTREELKNKLWPLDTFVDFDVGLNSAVKKLRDALGDSTEVPRYVETLPRRGYRFIAPVEEVPAGVGGREALPSPEPGSVTPGGTSVSTEPRAAAPSPRQPQLENNQTKTTRVRYTLLLGGAAAAIALLFGLNVGELRERLLGRASAEGAAAGRIRSLAVLPLENLSTDPEQEYFADGMTDEIITNLAQIDTLRVISRTSVMRYKGTRKPLPEIAKELNVDAVVEGTVMRSGNRVRITAQLIHAANEQHLWADQFERELRDVLSLQADVARAIATKIQLKLTPQQQVRLSAGRQVNPEVYDYYLKGRYNFSERSGKEAFDKAIRYFEMAIEKDPSYAPAYAGLVHCYSWGIFEGQELAPREAWSKATAAGKKALELDDQLGEAHIAMAEVRFRFDWDWPEAEREYKRGLELSPNDVVGHDSYSAFLGIMGRLDEALAEATRARELDPLSAQATASVGYVYAWSRRYDEAIAEFRRALQLDPNFIAAHDNLAQNYEEKEMYAEAVSEWVKARALKGDTSEEIESLRNAFAASGIRGYWEKELELDKRQLKHPRPRYTTMARLCVRLGRTDEAFRWLHKAYEAHSGGMPNVKVGPWLDPIRSDPRYAELIRRIGLPQ